MSLTYVLNRKDFAVQDRLGGDDLIQFFYMYYKTEFMLIYASTRGSSKISQGVVNSTQL